MNTTTDYANVPPPHWRENVTPITNPSVPSAQGVNSHGVRAYTSGMPYYNYSSNAHPYEIQIATRNIIEKLGKLFEQVNQWWRTPWGLGTQQPTSSRSRQEQVEEMKKQILEEQQSVFEQKFERALTFATKNWNDKTKNRLISQIRGYLEQPKLNKGDKHAEWKKIDARLKESFSDDVYQELRGLLVKKRRGKQPAPPASSQQQHPMLSKEDKDLPVNEKRSIQQSSPPVSDKQYLFDESESPWDRLSLCAYGEGGVIVGSTLNGSNFTHPNAQRVALFTLNGDILKRIDAVSTAISDQFPPRQGANNVATTCGGGYFHLLTEDPTQGIFHTVIFNQTLSLPQYLAISYTKINATVPNTAWRPAKLLNNRCAFAPAYDSTYYLSYTNTTGLFGPPGWNLYTFPNGLPELVHQEVLSFSDGTAQVLQNRGNLRRLHIPQFDFFVALDGTYIIDYNNQTIDQGIINQPYGARTPLPKNRAVTLIAPADNHTSGAVLTYLPYQTNVIASRLFNPDSGIGKEGRLSIAHCADNVDIYAYARDVVEKANYAIGYDVVNASLNSTSVIGGEQIYSNFTLSVPAHPEIGCFSNGTIMVAFLENGRPASFTFNFLESNTYLPHPVPAPSFPSPSPTHSLSPPPSPISSNGVTIEVKIPPSLGQGFIPITGEIVAISSNTASIMLIDKNGFKIVYSANSTDVPLFTQFTPGDIYTFDIARGNASEDSVPVFLGCNSEGKCSSSTAKHPLQAIFTTDGVNFALVLPLVILTPLAIATMGAIYYYKVILQQRKDRIEEARREGEEL